MHSFHQSGRTGTESPTTPVMQRPPAITHHWFSLFRVRSPLLTESLLFSLPVGTEMFHFPTFPPHTLYIQVQVTGHKLQPGFPIRKSSDHSLVIDSPRLIADSYVLLRFLVPRHPPFALSSLTIKLTPYTEFVSHLLADSVNASFTVAARLPARVLMLLLALPYLPCFQERQVNLLHLH